MNQAKDEEEELYYENLRQTIRTCKALLRKQLTDGGVIKAFTLKIVDKVDNTETTITIRPWEPKLN